MVGWKVHWWVDWRANKWADLTVQTMAVYWAANSVESKAEQRDSCWVEQMGF